VIEIGKYNKLRILRETSVGLFLGDQYGEDVLLPNKYCPKDYKIEDKIEVFVYLDHEERKVATNLTPYILLHEFAVLEVVGIADSGAFLSWGMEKDLLVPFKEQREEMKLGQSYLVYLDIDEKTNRLYATSQIEKRIQNEILSVTEGDEVELVVFRETNLGFSVIVNNAHQGLLFKNLVLSPLKIGDKMLGYITQIREENKLDISLQPIGYEVAIPKFSEDIFHALIDGKGFLELTDKSTPADIYKQFGMSKKTFKKAVGDLYKKGKITLEPNGIRLVE